MATTSRPRIAEGRIIHINLGRAFEISDMSAKILVIAQRAGWQMRWAKSLRSPGAYGCVAPSGQHCDSTCTVT